MSRIWDIVHRDHRKLLIVDGKAMISDINFSDAYCKGGTNQVVYNVADKRNEVAWRDAAYLVEGPAVQQLNRVFFQNWADGRALNAEERAICDQQIAPIAGGKRVWVAADRPSKENHHNIARLNDAARALATKEKIDHPDEEVIDTVVTAYFAPPDRDMARWLDELKNGVKVRIMVPAPSVIDESVDGLRARDYLLKMKQAGAQIWYFDKSMLHEKAESISVNGVGVYFRGGSPNENGRSDDEDDEAAIGTVDRDSATQREMRFEQLKHSFKGPWVYAPNDDRLPWAYQPSDDELIDKKFGQKVENFFLKMQIARRNY